jgi:ABC-type phosphate transport system substrate-binding protein
MTSFLARRLVPACAVCAAAVVALVAPGAANAELGTPCSGSNLKGQGSSAQKTAQQKVWIPGFHESADKFACNGTQGSKGTPVIEEYNPSGSGAGLNSWGVGLNEKGEKERKYESTNAFVGTDEAPNAGQLTEIEEGQTKLPPEMEKVATVPVAQFAVAIIVNLPTGCTATSLSNKGRLVLNFATLESIYRGTIRKWSEITENGDKLLGTGCTATTAIKKIVRFDQSGTTHVFKKFLGLVNKTSFEATNKKGEVVGSRTWDEVSEGPENTTWPTADAAEAPTEKGGGKLVALVASTPSSIGYANLSDARGNAAFIPTVGGPNTATFWVPIQNKTVAPITYQDPSKNKELAVASESNCASETYTNGSEAFPPANVLKPWNEVTTKTVEPKYTLCGLTFDLGFTKYGLFPSTSLGEATTANNYLRFVTDTAKEKEGNKMNGGQALLKGHDYEPLVGTVLKEAQKGAALVGD